MMNMEMNVGYLKDVIKNLPDDMLVFVACNGDCNYDFIHGVPRDGTDTFAIIHDGKLFITDQYNVICKDGTVVVI